jgi:hypothetical protein
MTGEKLAAKTRITRMGALRTVDAPIRVIRVLAASSSVLNFRNRWT